jgi:hypothetical protein
MANQPCCVADVTARGAGVFVVYKSHAKARARHVTLYVRFGSVNAIFGFICLRFL